jgi:hypothetical protein
MKNHNRASCKPDIIRRESATSIESNQVSKIFTALFHSIALKLAPVASFKTYTLKPATGASFRVYISAKGSPHRP